MVEVTVAIAAASRAVTIIKKGLALGKDTQELSSQFAQFFDAKDKIDKAKADSDHAPIGKKVFAAQSVEAYALEVALAEHKAKELEKQLRELFVYSGQADVYKSMMRARQKERQRRLVVARKIAERRKFLLDLTLIGTMIISGMMFLGFIVTSVMGS
jgi:hypothetical protein|tara:strand:+ start:145 stop:615 length:471 start_codon:yes stop_codon:yes gene_type:complete